LGVDLVEIARIREILERHGERFLARVYTEAEVAYCRTHREPAPSLAARFAAKEAAFKVLGTGWGEGVRWRDVEVVRDPRGAPRRSRDRRPPSHHARTSGSPQRPKPPREALPRARGRARPHPRGGRRRSPPRPGRPRPRGARPEARAGIARREGRAACSSRRA